MTVLTTSTLSLYSRLEHYVRLTKPRVVMLIVFTAFIGMLLAQPSVAPLNILIYGSLGIWLVAGAAAAVNCLIEQRIDAVMARTRGRPLPIGAVTELETVSVSLVVGGGGFILALCVYQSADHVADTRYICRLCHYLYDGAKAINTSKYCYRWCIWSHAACSWLGRSDRGSHPRGLTSFFNYICLDTAAFLGISVISQRRIREGRSADVTCDARCRVHPASCFFIHFNLVGGFYAPFCSGYE